MKVLMFGWEYPPHVYGGLATANFGISEGLHVQGDNRNYTMLARPFGDEDKTFANMLLRTVCPIVYRDIDDGYLRQRLATLWIQTYITICAITYMPTSTI